MKKPKNRQGRKASKRAKIENNAKTFCAMMVALMDHMKTSGPLATGRLIWGMPTFPVPSIFETMKARGDEVTDIFINGKRPAK